MTLKVGNASAFWGDSSFAAQEMVANSDLDFLTFDYLAELSLSIMAVQREKDASCAYAKDFVKTVESLTAFWKKGKRLKIVSNAGGLDPLLCAKACKDVLTKAGLSLKIGAVSGDDVLDQLKQDPGNPLFQNMETLEPLNSLKKPLLTANAYFGAQGIKQALEMGADIVITGRVADPSLAVGPALFHFGWEKTEYDKIAGATVAGHLIECGTQSTGGMSTNWLLLENPFYIGFPIAEIKSDGSFILTKPKHTGGAVDIQTVTEQLLYEIGDPDNYLSPDAAVSFLGIKLEQQGKDRVQVTGAKGKPPPGTYKVSASYKNGYKTEGMLAVFGNDAVKKAFLSAEVILKRLEKHGVLSQQAHVSCLGAGGIVPGVFKGDENQKECVLRIALADERKEVLECFSKEFASLITCGPQGIAGYASGRPRIRPVAGYWGCLIDVASACPKVEIL